LPDGAIEFLKRSEPALKTLAALLTASVLAMPMASSAEAPEPTKPVSASFYSGKWYEIARLPTKSQNGCEGNVTAFTGAGAGGDFNAVQTCHVGSLAGPLKSIDVTGHVKAGESNAKFVLTFYKVIKQEYWIIDRADSMDWAVMATPGGNYVWLLSRKPTMSAGDKASVVARLKAAGYPVEKLIYPQQG
jgi:apolipoprotein D and lipocalin family protein